MQQPKRIAMILPNMKDGTSLYRGMGPLTHLRRRFPGTFEFVMLGDYHWATLQTVDAVFLQRPYKEDHVTIVQMAQDNAKPVWVDYDDNLFSVPKSNVAHSVYGNDRVKHNIAKILAMADKVSVSTAHLARRLNPIRLKAQKDPCWVIPNALNEFMFPLKPYGTQRPLVLWRGSATHQGDLLRWMPQIADTVKRFPNVCFTFLGEPGWQTERLLEGQKNVVFAGSLDPIEYFRCLGELRPELMLVPLEDDEFNRSKSNIAWLEGAYCGAISVAPDWEEWQVPGTLRYQDKRNDLGDILYKALRFKPEVREEMRQEARKFVQENLTLDKVNRMRVDLIGELIPSDAP